MFAARRSVLVWLLFPVLAGCVSQEGSRVPVMRPVPVDLGQYEVVAVDRFSGDGCDVLAAELTKTLRSTVNPLTGASDFEVLDRRDVDRMLDNLRRTGGENWDQLAMEVLNRWKQAEILIKAEVHAHSVAEELNEDGWTDKEGVHHTGGQQPNAF